MTEGFYRLDFLGLTGYTGFGVLAFDTGMVVGADSEGGCYDGSYAWNEESRLLDADVAVRLPEGTLAVQGHRSDGRPFNVKCSFPREPDNEVVTAETDLGPVAVRIHLLRRLSDFD